MADSVKRGTSSAGRMKFPAKQILTLVRSDSRDLTLRQLGLLLICGSTAEPQTASRLAVLLNIPKAGLTQAAHRLEREKLLLRRKNPNDLRSVLHSLTPLGYQYYQSFLGRGEFGPAKTGGEIPQAQMGRVPKGIANAMQPGIGNPTACRALSSRPMSAGAAAEQIGISRTTEMLGLTAAISAQ